MVAFIFVFFSSLALHIILPFPDVHGNEKCQCVKEKKIFAYISILDLTYRIKSEFNKVNNARKQN